MKLTVLHVASEVAPFSKSGGLADVTGALPAALARLGFEVLVVTPRYRGVDPERHGMARWLRPLEVELGAEKVEVTVHESSGGAAGRVRTFLIDHPPSFDREGLYGPPGGEWEDNARRYTLLGRAAWALMGRLGVQPDVLHGHDWQAGPAILEAVRPSRSRAVPAVVFTIHNLAYQGQFDAAVIDQLGLPRDLFHPDGYEFYGRVNLLKAGIALADRITTVSPRYAWEIQTPEGGQGLDGLLRARADRLTGILNGVDYDRWDPSRDPHIAAHYSKDDLLPKRRCKEALQRELGLPVFADTPLCGSITRLTEQKGFDLVLEVLPRLLEAEDLQYVLLGAGDPGLEQAFQQLRARFPRQIAVRIGYDERLAHRIEAGCDLYVMPSRFEPCGLNQLYSLRYGTPPIVRAVGGLYDTIVDYDGPSASGNGFRFEALTPDALAAAWRRALLVYREARPAFLELARRGMAQDFSWAAAARRYAEVYRLALDPTSR